MYGVRMTEAIDRIFSKYEDVIKILELPPPVFIPDVDKYLRQTVKDLMKAASFETQQGGGEEIVNSAYRRILNNIQNLHKRYDQCKNGLVAKKKMVNERLMDIMEAVQFVDLMKALSAHNVSVPFAVSVTGDNTYNTVDVNASRTEVLVWIGPGVLVQMSFDDARARLVALFKFHSKLVDHIQSSLNHLIDSLCTLQVSVIRISSHARMATNAKVQHQTKIAQEYMEACTEAEKLHKQRAKEEARRDKEDQDDYLRSRAKQDHLDMKTGFDSL